MRRYLATMMALVLAALATLAAPTAGAVAEGGNTRVVLIQCEQQDFSTACLEGLTWEWKDDLGVQIYTQEPGYNPYMLIYWNDTGEKFDAKKYLDEVFTPEMQQKYGDRLLEVEPYKTYTVQGVEMPGIKYRYVTNNGSEGILFRLFDLRWGGNVCYTLRYYPDDPDDTLNALAIAVHFFHPGAHYYDNGGNGGNSGSGGGATAMNGYSVKRAEPIVADTYVYEDARFQVELPAGWKIVATGDLANSFCFKAYDPANPSRCFFRTGALYPFMKSEAAKRWWQENPGRTALPGMKITSDAPVLEDHTLACFLSHATEIRLMAEKYADSRDVLDPAVFPVIEDLRVLDTTPSPVFRIPTCEENLVARITFTDEYDVACEGVMTAQPSNDGSLISGGVDIWPDSVYQFMGFAAPVGELRELEPVLSRCLSSFLFSEEYLRQTLQTIVDTGEIVRQMNATMLEGRACYDALWDDRTDAYDVLSQKWSDATLGYDRLYDSETGEIYRAETGFWDDYELHRYEYQNPNLQIIDAGTEDYYLRSVDYTISR